MPIFKFTTGNQTLKILPFAFLTFLACAQKLTPDQMSKQQIDAKANALAQEYIIVDGHVDLPYRLNVTNFRLEKEFLGIPISTDKGDFDWERSRAGGLDAPFMSIYIPSSYQETGGAKAFADGLIDMVQGIIQAHPNHYGSGHSPDEIKQNFKKGLVSLPMGMENGAPIEDKIEHVKYFYDRGIRYITLTHAKDNLICDSSYDTTRTWGGLSPFGKEVVKEMNRVGIMVDISHVSDQTFFDVMELTDVPVIASHSSARKFTPGFERNMSDDMIRLLGEKNGVIMINFGSTFLDGKIEPVRSKDYQDKFNAFIAKKGLQEGSRYTTEILEEFAYQNPEYYSTIEMVANHIDHVVKIAGIDHVGFGSDYDGVGDSLPNGLKDVSDFPNLIAELIKRGYSDEDIEKICYKNLFRVWNAVESAAEK